MSTPFPTSVDLLSDGTPVNAATTNVPITELAQRTQSNKEKIDNGLYGSALIAYNVPLDSDSTVGMAVYIGTNGAYHKAYAQVSIDSANDFQLNPTSFAVGLILNKNTATSGDVVLQGVCTIPIAALNAVSLSGNLSYGQQIYLGGDNTHPGYVTNTKPLIAVPLAVVCGPNTDNSATVIVAPAPRPNLFNHIHYKASLTMTHTAGDQHSALASTQGWLDTSVPANFPGKVIPVGAVYGYNITADPVLAPLWPPIPLYSVYLERNGNGVRITGTAGQVICQIDAYGIWWMTNCATDQPFGQSAIVDGSGCLSYPDRLDLWFVKINALTDTPVVATLTPSDNSINLTDTNGNNATSGNLFIKAAIPTDGGSSTAGYLAVKEIGSSSGSTYFKRGPIVEGVRSLNTDLTLVGSGSFSEVDPSDSSTYTWQAGLVHVNYVPPSAGREGNLSAVVFDNTEEATINNIPMYSMRVGRTSSIRGQMRVPNLGVGTPMNLNFKFMFYATATGAFPTTMTLTKRTVRPTGADYTNTVLPSSDTAVETLDFSSATPTAGSYFEKTTVTAISVNPGDIIYISLARTSTDSYAGDVNILDIRWTLS